jgi:hypothetical protein
VEKLAASFKLEHDKALGRVMTALLADHTELFKQYSDNPSFKNGTLILFSR